MDFPQTLTFENGLKLRRTDDADAYVLVQPWTDAACYRACRLFCGCDAQDMNAIDSGLLVQSNWVYLNDTEGFPDETGRFIAQALAIADTGGTIIRVSDDTLEHVALYAQSFA